MPRDKSSPRFFATSILLLSVDAVYAFTSISPSSTIRSSPAIVTSTTLAGFIIQNPFQGLLDNLPSLPSFPVIGDDPSKSVDRICKARDIVKYLVEEAKGFATESGALAFGDRCASDCAYEDCYEPNTIAGKEAVTLHMVEKVNQRKGKGDVRIDRISDGSLACGFAWTWVSSDGNEEGLRGTTFVQLNDSDEIQYIREIPEPIYKPGDLTLELLRAVTKDAKGKPPTMYTAKTPKSANEVAKYLFLDLQGSDIKEAMRLFSDDIVYRDFNYDEPLRGPAMVRQFIQDFSFPGIEFKPDRFDDGVLSTCFTWDVCLEGAEKTIKGVSFYELDPESRLITYVRDVPESAIKPPPLGALARILRPGLGVFQGVPSGSRPGGL